MVRHYKFNVVLKNTTRLCSTKPIVTVNGRYPGPTLVAREDDTILVNVVNHVKYNISVHWHGVRQIRTDTIVITPGKTTNVLLTTHRRAGKYMVVALPFMDAPIAVDNVTATATLYYSGSLTSTATTLVIPPPKNATSVAASFTNALRSLNSKQYPANVPLTIDHSLVFTVGLGINSCPTCVNGSRVVASINNVTFVMPKTALLEAHFFNIEGVFTSDFPGNPPVPFNYTSTQLTNLATKLYRLGYNDTVQLVLQDTGMITPENHPLHLHGFNFFEVGRGMGNFEPEKDPENFNVVDPVERNTIGVPSGGWAAIRFRADNPGRERVVD
ncbi:hypothetical protein V6N13_010825 [Hibiscus sabdariffa]